MSYIDVPTQDEILELASIREPACVSIYVYAAAGPDASDTARIEVHTRLRSATELLEAAGTDAHTIESIRAAVESLLVERDFWRRDTRTLAIFANGTSLVSFHLANTLLGLTEVSDRFAITPVLRATTFPHSAFVLALSQNAVRLIDVSPASPANEIEVPDLPHDLKTTVALDLTNGRQTLAHLRTSEDPKIRMREFSQAVDRALRPIVADSDRPMILAATEPLASIYRSVSTDARLAKEMITGNPETISALELAASATPILDSAHAAELATQIARFHDRTSRGLADDTLTGVALAAMSKAIDTLFVDIDQRIPGRIDELTGIITRTEDENETPENKAPANETTYDVIDEIVRRALSSDARIFAVRGSEVPGNGPVAATLRFPVNA